MVSIGEARQQLQTQQRKVTSQIQQIEATKLPPISRRELARATPQTQARLKTEIPKRQAQLEQVKKEAISKVRAFEETELKPFEKQIQAAEVKQARLQQEFETKVRKRERTLRRQQKAFKEQQKQIKEGAFVETDGKLIDVAKLKQQGFKPIFVNGEIAGFEDPALQMSIPIEHIESFLKERTSTFGITQPRQVQVDPFSGIVPERREIFMKLGKVVRVVSPFIGLPKIKPREVVDVVKFVSPALEKAAPIIEKVKPFVGFPFQITPSDILKTTPVVSKITPFIGLPKIKPREVVDVVKFVSPALEKAAPIIEKVKPFVGFKPLITPVTVVTVAPSIVNVVSPGLKSTLKSDIKTWKSIRESAQTFASELTPVIEQVKESEKIQVGIEGSKPLLDQIKKAKIKEETVLEPEARNILIQIESVGEETDFERQQKLINSLEKKGVKFKEVIDPETGETILEIETPEWFELLRPGFQKKKEKETFKSYFFRKLRKGVGESTAEVYQRTVFEGPTILQPKEVVEITREAELVGKGVAIGAELGAFVVPGVREYMFFGGTAEAALRGPQPFVKFAKEEPVEVAVSALGAGIGIVKGVKFLRAPVKTLIKKPQITAEAISRSKIGPISAESKFLLRVKRTGGEFALQPRIQKLLKIAPKPSQIIKGKTTTFFAGTPSEIPQKFIKGFGLRRQPITTIGGQLVPTKLGEPVIVRLREGARQLTFYRLGGRGQIITKANWSSLSKVQKKSLEIAAKKAGWTGEGKVYDFLRGKEISVGSAQAQKFLKISRTKATESVGLQVKVRKGIPELHFYKKKGLVSGINVRDIPPGNTITRADIVGVMERKAFIKSLAAQEKAFFDAEMGIAKFKGATAATDVSLPDIVGRRKPLPIKETAFVKGRIDVIEFAPLKKDVGFIEKLRPLKKPSAPWTTKDIKEAIKTLTRGKPSQPLINQVQKTLKVKKTPWTTKDIKEAIEALTMKKVPPSKLVTLLPPTKKAQVGLVPKIISVKPTPIISAVEQAALKTIPRAPTPPTPKIITRPIGLKIFPVVPVKEILEVKTIIKPSVEIKIIPATVLKPILKTTLKPVLKPALKPILKPTLKPVLKPALKPVLKPILKTTLKPVLKPALKPILKPILKPGLKPAQKPPKAPVTRFVPPIIILPGDEILRRAQRRKPVRKKKPLFTPEVRRKGKWVSLGKFKNPKRAIAVGKKRALDTAAASVRLKQNGKIIPIKPTKLFRRAKKEPGVIVQKKRKRILSKGEKREITLIGVKAAKAKRIKAKKKKKLKPTNKKTKKKVKKK